MKKILTTLSAVMSSCAMMPDAVATLPSLSLGTENTSIETPCIKLDSLESACDVWCSSDTTDADKVQAKNTLYELVKVAANKPIEQIRQVKARSSHLKLNKLLDIIHAFRSKNWYDNDWANDNDMIRLYELIARIQIETAKDQPPILPPATNCGCFLKENSNVADCISCINLLYEAKMIHNIALFFCAEGTASRKLMDSFCKSPHLKAEELESLGLYTYSLCDIIPQTLINALSDVKKIKSLCIHGSGMEDWRCFLDFILNKNVQKLEFDSRIAPDGELDIFLRDLSNNDRITDLRYTDIHSTPQSIKLVSEHLPSKLKEVSLTFWLDPETEFDEEYARKVFNAYSNVFNQCPEISRINIQCDHYQYDVKSILSDPKLCQSLYEGVLQLKPSDKASAAEEDTAISEIGDLLKDILDGKADEKVAQTLQDKIALSSARDSIERLICELGAKAKKAKKAKIESLIKTYGSKPVLMLQAAIVPSLKELNFESESVVPLEILQKTSLQDRINAAMKYIHPAFAKIDTSLLVREIENLARRSKNCTVNDLIKTSFSTVKENISQQIKTENAELQKLEKQLRNNQGRLDIDDLHAQITEQMGKIACLSERLTKLVELLNSCESKESTN